MTSKCDAAQARDPWRVSITAPEDDFGWPRGTTDVTDSSGSGRAAPGRWFSSRNPGRAENEVAEDDDDEDAWWQHGRDELAKIRAVPMSPAMVIYIHAYAYIDSLFMRTCMRT